MASTSIGGEPGPAVNTTTPLPFRDRDPDRDRDPETIEGSSETAARIDRYALLRVLGGGGMGVVYAAYDEHLDRKVALKVLSERNTIATAANRMHREAQALARLSHPNVVGVHDVGIAEGRVFMAMEFISGQTLRTWLRAEDRSYEEILRVFVEAGRGLAAAHAAGIVHRDFKPDNVMVDDYGPVRVLGASRSRIPNFYRPRSRIDPGSTQFQGDHSRSSRPASGCSGCITGGPRASIDPRAVMVFRSAPEPRAHSLGAAIVLRSGLLVPSDDYR